jgi:hypothetical protein
LAHVDTRTSQHPFFGQLANLLHTQLAASVGRLDVDCLDDLGKLEESVEASVCVGVFLSKGYFASANCRS